MALIESELKGAQPTNSKLTAADKDKKKKTTKNTLNCSVQGLDSRKFQDKNRIRSLVQSIQNNETKSQSQVQGSMLDICSLENIRNFRQAQNLLQPERELSKSKMVSRIIFDLQLKGLIQEEADFKVQGYSPRMNEFPTARERSRATQQSRQETKKATKKDESKPEAAEERKKPVSTKGPALRA